MYHLSVTKQLLQVVVYFFLIGTALIFLYIIISEGLFILAKHRMWVRWRELQRIWNENHEEDPGNLPLILAPDPVVD